VDSPGEQDGAGDVGTATSDVENPTSDTEDAARAATYRWSVPLRAVLTVVAGVCLPLMVWCVVRATQVPTPMPCGPETSGPPCPADVGPLILGAAVTFVGAAFFGIVAAIMGATPPRLARRFGFLYLLAVLVGCVLAEPWADAVARALT